MFYLSRHVGMPQNKTSPQKEELEEETEETGEVVGRSWEGVSAHPSERRKPGMSLFLF